MRSPLLSLLILVTLGCATHPELGGGPPRSQALKLASDDLRCAEESLQTQVVEGFLLVTGCGSAAAYAPEGDVWALRLKYRVGGWVFGRKLLKEDVAVFARAAEDLKCDPREVLLQRELGVRVARGCGFRRAYTVVCGEELHELGLDDLPRYLEVAAATAAEAVGQPKDAAVPPFDAGVMTRPKKVCGREPSFTDVSLKKRATGAGLFKCTLTREGFVEACRVIQPLEHHTEVFLDALYSQRFEPATFNGDPVSVDYVFAIRAILPP